MSFRPAEWSIAVDPLVEKLVPVQANIPGRPAFGFEISGYRSVPESVRVSGPLRTVEQLPFVRTRAMDISQRSEDLDRLEVELLPPAPPLKLATSSVTVSVDIREEFVQRRFAGVPVEVVNGEGILTAATAVVTVLLKGPRRIVDKIGRTTLKATVDVASEMARGETHFSKAVVLQNLPERTRVIGPAPEVALGPETTNSPP
jgi:YbbR domain-containing protein